MKTYDWIVIGAGITGSALSYELSKLGFQVLLLDRALGADRATRYSYGAVLWHWAAGKIKVLFHEGKARHEQLSEELGKDTGFRVLPILLTLEEGQSVPAEEGGEWLSQREALAVEPLLNPEAIAGAILLPQAQVDPIALNEAYQHAFQRQGGVIAPGEVGANGCSPLLQKGDRLLGVVASAQTYYAANIAVCAGGWTRHLLHQAGVNVPVYFTHTEVIEIPHCSLRLSGLVLPAQTQRYQLEADASQADLGALWDWPGYEPSPAILDPGAVQFPEGRVILGQISRVLTDPYAQVDAQESERQLRAGVGRILPALAQQPGRWYSCLAAFSRQQLALVGAVPGKEGLYVFSGFEAPFTLVPAIAPRFARQVAGTPDPLLAELGLLQTGNS